MSCCSENGTCSTTATVEAPAAAVTTVYAVAGMTCGHCEQAVGKAVSALAGVTAVSVDVQAGLVTVSAEAEPDEAALRAAIDDAGYELTGRA
ncbi:MULTISPECIES: cation transporter [Streptomycetaceae]|uniref:heavy-metal-associated domain-containing protein n=1 Tax=Streptomycetaceae TaxID=2062 RepID=UPI000CDCACE6|nr:MULTISPECIES: cation transporter [Streptomycetaceae]AUY52998.1 copper-binding protein [Streptomyces sp. CB01881]MBP0448771.1 heavy-metal-associated domain-containing protein [Kitasatospora sp. RG8]TYC70713.1 heavy-metal-associated domain-containing protein [Streptomyces sp. CB01881]